MVPPRSTNPWKIPLPSVKPAGKVAGIVYLSRSVWTAPGTTYSVKVPPDRKNECMVAIAGDVVTADCAGVIDASSFGKTDGIVRVDDRRAKATIAEPDKTARHPA